MWFWFLCAAAAVYSAEGAGPGAARLVCYVEGAHATELSECTHLVYAGDARGDKLDSLLKDYRKSNPRLKIVLRVTEADKDLSVLLKSKNVQGVEIYDAHKTFNKTKILEFVEKARTALTSSGGGPLFLALPAHPELLAKYYDLRVLVKKADLMMVHTHALGMVKNMTYHPSRLSGLWDMMNTDSVVDLVIGLGVPASKVVISLPATARQFTLLNETLSTPGSPTANDDPKEIDQAELCRQLRKGRWTLERDQDLSAPYAFKGKTWISFEDASSVDVKGKYARVRGLAGLALYNAERDVDTPCAATLRTALSKVLNQQSRAPRAAVLRSLENEILSAPHNGRALDALQVSPYRITQVVDSDGVIHSIREDTRTEFTCSRQGYFVHPRSCARFYRCVKFDQLSPEYTVFEFDCPAGLAFDSRYEVCVWPGALAQAAACPGSSEIAPVPATRFICPPHEGYYADPENCRWFFACLDHGQAPLVAYEFRCPFGLGFDAARMKCEWPWLVPACGNIARYEAEAFGFSGAALSGATGFQGKTADSVNIAAHQSLVSGASLNNLVGIQNGLLTKDDILDANYISSQEAANVGFAGPQTYQIDDSFSNIGLGYQGEPSGHSYKYVSADDINKGLIQATNYNGEEKYSSGSIILDDYRLPANKANNLRISNEAQILNSGAVRGSLQFDNGKYRGNNAYAGVSPKYDSSKSKVGFYRKDNSGKYVHNPAGDKARPYEHIDIPPVAYTHTDFKYTQSNENDAGKYAGGYLYPKPSIEFNEGIGVNHNVHSIEGQLNGYHSSGTEGGATNTYQGSYANADVGKYVSEDKVYTGAVGAVNVGLVGKTSLLDADYASQGNYQGQSYSHGVVHQVSQPAVSISHVGTASQNQEGYSFTTPTSSVVPTTVTPISYTTYKTTYVPEAPKTSIKQVFGYTQPAVTYVQPTIVPVEHVTPKIQVTDHNQGLNYQYESKDYSTYNIGSTGKSEFEGYDYSKPNIQFESGVSYSTTPAPTVVSYNPQEFGQSQQTVHKTESVGYGYSTPIPVTEQPFKKLVAYTTGSPVSSFVQQSSPAFSQQTIHKVETSNTYLPPIDVSGQEFANTAVNYEVPQTVTQYTTPRPSISVQPAVSTYQPQSFSQQTLHTIHKVKTSNTYLPPIDVSGQEFANTAVSYEVPQTVIQYSTPQPSISVQPAVSTYQPQSFSQQTQHTIHKVKTSNTYLPPIDVSGQEFANTAVSYEVPQTVIQYSTPQPSISVQPAVSTYQPQSFSQQTQHTIHKVKTSNTYLPPIDVSGQEFANTAVSYEVPQTVIQYSTPQPSISVQPAVSTYQPQSFSQQTLHTVDATKVNSYSQSQQGYEYQTPSTVSLNTDYESSYEYKQPNIRLQEANVVQYSTPAPTYKPQSYSSQSIHRSRTQYVPVSTTIRPFVSTTPVTVYENPLLQYTSKATEQSYDTPKYTSQAYSQQTIHRDDSIGSQVANVYQYTSGGQEQESTLYSTPQPILSVQSPVSTYPQYQNQQTLHQVDTSRLNTYEGASINNDYSQPAVSIEQQKYVTSTPAPFVSSTNIPQSYSHQTLHKYEKQRIPSTTPISTIHLTYQQPEVSVYENPILKYTQKVTPTSYVQPTETVFTSTLRPATRISHVTRPVQYETEQQAYINQEGYTYNQPEIQRNIETFKTPSYSDASVVSSQYFHQGDRITQNHRNEQNQSGKNVVFVSTTPASLIYEDHYAEYENQRKVNTYKAPEYIPPKEELQQTYTVSTASTPIVRQQSSIVHTQDQYDYQPIDNSQQYGAQYTTSNAGSSSNNYKYTQNTYQSPEIQVAYKAEEYLPPVSSTVRPIVTSTYRPRTYSTTANTREYLPPVSETKFRGDEYLPPVENIYQSTAKSVNSLEILPPFERTASRVATFQKFGFNDGNEFQSNDEYNTYQDYTVSTEAPIEFSTVGARKHNIVIETAKANLLGFGTVGPDAGLVQTTYTTAQPFISSTDHSYLPPKTVTSTYAPEIVEVTTATRKTRPKYVRPIQVESTTVYQAPEYLPPSEEFSQGIVETGYRSTVAPSIRYNPYQDKSYDTQTFVSTTPVPARKKNIVVENAKARLLGFGTVGSDAGLVSPVSYSTTGPIELSHIDTYSTAVPVRQELVEVTSARAPVRRTKPRVAVVTKINDFNPLLVRKLGAVCSCQSPVLVLKGRRPNIQEQDVDDYDSGYDDDGRGDISGNAYRQKSARITAAPVLNTVTTASPVTSTFNPIIVPDDSYYQDYQEASNDDIVINPARNEYSESYASNTPEVSTTERVIRIRPRVKSVTVAPTYKTVLLNEQVSPVITKQSGSVSAINSQSFDRYGPGGWRSRDETLQGSIDCQRAGLFRHPKQCNKFYACRWDCTKQRFTLHVFNCPVQLSFDPNLGACNWPSQGPSCQGDTLLTNTL